jgi:stage III sporulation protein AE
LTLLLDFMQKGINLALKLLIGLMTGLSLVQALILPVADGLKISAVRKSLSAIPGIGGVAGSVTDLFMGSAVLIKNSVGVLLLILLLAVCLLPLGKIALFSGIVKLGAALTGIVSDKRISGATNRVGEGCFMLLKCVGTSMAMFFIVIAVVAYTLTG